MHGMKSNTSYNIFAQIELSTMNDNIWRCPHTRKLSLSMSLRSVSRDFDLPLTEDRRRSEPRHVHGPNTAACVDLIAQYLHPQGWCTTNSSMSRYSRLWRRLAKSPSLPSGLPFLLSMTSTKQPRTAPALGHAWHSVCLPAWQLQDIGFRLIGPCPDASDLSKVPRYCQHDSMAQTKQWRPGKPSMPSAMGMKNCRAQFIGSTGKSRVRLFQWPGVLVIIVHTGVSE